MKLYATVTSERASKVQGGNETLDIELAVGNAKQPASAGVITVREVETGVFKISYLYNGKRTKINTINTEGSIFEPINGKK